MVLICISLMINDVEHLFMCLLAICTSLEKSLFGFLPNFLDQVFCFLTAVLKRRYYSFYFTVEEIKAQKDQVTILRPHRSTAERIITMWYVPTTEYYLALKRNKVLIHATTRMSFENLMLSLTQKNGLR